MRKQCLAFTAFLTGLPGIVLASPEAAAAAQNSPFAGDFGTALWTLVIFGAVLWVLSKYAWGPILDALQGREQFIRDSLEQAKRQRDEAEQRLKEYEEKLAAARTETAAILDEARRDAEALKVREGDRTKAEADKLLDRAKREIEIAKDTAIKDLYSRAAVLATSAAARILEREISPSDHERLIADSIAAIEQMKTN